MMPRRPSCSKMPSHSPRSMYFIFSIRSCPNSNKAIADEGASALTLKLVDDVLRAAVGGVVHTKNVGTGAPGYRYSSKFPGDGL